MGIDKTHLSKAVSHVLRHEPWLYELELDAQGWVSIDELLSALRAQADEWKKLTRFDIERMIETSGKKRHEVDSSGFSFRSVKNRQSR